MATQVDIITSTSVAARVVDALGLDKVPRIRKEFEKRSGGHDDMRLWIAESLLKKLVVVPARESSVLGVSFKDTDPKFAADVANAFAAAYQEAAVTLRTGPIKKASAYLEAQVRESLAKLEKAQNDYSAFQEKHNILSADSQADVEMVRYNELSSQLVAVQGQLMEASARSRQARGDAAAAPDVVANPLIQSLKSEWTRAQAKLANMAERFGQRHPQYIESQAEVDKLQAELSRQSMVVGQSVNNNAGILARREAQLRAEISAQKARILEQNRARDALAILSKQTESARRAYSAASERFAQVDIESQSSQSDVAILSWARPPQTPASPNIQLNMIMATFMGLALGFGLAFLAELNDHRVRSPHDLVTHSRTPLLAVIGD
jgi:chain length determinant protein EpsF